MMFAGTTRVRCDWGLLASPVNVGNKRSSLLCPDPNGGEESFIGLSVSRYSKMSQSNLSRNFKSGSGVFYNPPFKILVCIHDSLFSL